MYRRQTCATRATRIITDVMLGTGSRLFGTFATFTDRCMDPRFDNDRYLSNGQARRVERAVLQVASCMIPFKSRTASRRSRLLACLGRTAAGSYVAPYYCVEPSGKRSRTRSAQEPACLMWHFDDELLCRSHNGRASPSRSETAAADFHKLFEDKNTASRVKRRR